MTNAIVSKLDVIKLFQEESRWDGTLSHRGMGRLSGVKGGHKTLISGGNIKSKRLAETLENKGLDPEYIFNNGWSIKAAIVCLNYYAYKANQTSPQAEALMEAFGAVGLTAIHAEALGKVPVSTITHPEKEDNLARQISNLERIGALVHSLPSPSPIILQAYEDRIRDLLQPPTQPQLAPTAEKTEWTIRDRLEYREIRGCENYESQIGRLAAKKYREKYSKDPLKGHRIFNGKQRKCTIYLSS